MGERESEERASLVADELETARRRPRSTLPPGYSSVSFVQPHAGRRVRVAGIEVDNVTQDEALSRIDNWLDGTKPVHMEVVNAAKIVASVHDDRLREAITRADLVTADGMSVVWAARLLGGRLKERVTGIDTFERLVERAALRGRSVFFLGASQESVAGVVARFQREYPQLRVAGYRNGYFAAYEEAAVAGEIRRSGAELLFVAMGSPRQEYWISAHLAASGARFALGVGGAFDHLSGLSRRAPKWMQRSGLEWLYRLLSEPRRLWRRYLIGNTHFTWLILKQLLTRDEVKP